MTAAASPPAVDTSKSSMTATKGPADAAGGTGPVGGSPTADAGAAHPSSVLVTIPVSHCCDKARWALDMAGHQYKEDMFPPMVHLLGTWLRGLKVRSTPQLILLGAGGAGEGKKQQQQVLPDSADIMRWAAKTYPDTPAGQLYPPGMEEEVAKWEKLFDTQLGPQARVIAYQWLFQDGPQAVVPLINRPGMPPWRAWAYRTFYPLITTAMRAAMNINASYAERCIRKVRGVFAEVSSALSDGRPFIIAGSTAPTAADITFAALAAPLILPAHYGGALDIQVPEPTAPGWPGTELSVTRAGKHCHRMYEQFRMPPFGQLGGGGSVKGGAKAKGGGTLTSPLASPIGTGVAASPPA